MLRHACHANNNFVSLNKITIKLRPKIVVEKFWDFFMTTYLLSTFNSNCGARENRRFTLVSSKVKVPS